MVFTSEDFRAARGRIVFAEQRNGGPVKLSPADAHVEMWNAHFPLPPAVVADYLDESLSSLPVAGLDMRPRMVFSAANAGVFAVFDLWPRDIEPPLSFNQAIFSRCLALGHCQMRMDEGEVSFIWTKVRSSYASIFGNENLQRRGIGMALAGTVIPLFMEAGYDRAAMDAMSEAGNKSGAYVWSRCGMDVAPESYYLRLGLDKLPHELRSRFNMIARRLPGEFCDKAKLILDNPGPGMATALTDIRCEMDDPALPGKKTQAAEYLLRDVTIRGLFNFRSPAWRERFFGYVGTDRRPQLRAALGRGGPA